MKNLEKIGIWLFVGLAAISAVGSIIALFAEGAYGAAPLSIGIICLCILAYPKAKELVEKVIYE